MATAYHHGSVALQDRLGLRDAAAHIAPSIRPGIRPVAAAFLELQPMLVLGAAAPDGRVWATLLTGAPGFARATGPHAVSVAAAPRPDDPLAEALSRETRVGTIALDPRTRRRMRLNGTARPGAHGVLIEAEQVFANCPKYLQKRELYGSDPAGPGSGIPPVRRGEALTEAQLAAVRAADTFFVATTGPDGADASHRGGNPGFVRAEDTRTLEWRDYPGNAMFLTLGNLETDDRAGLLFLDWESGTTLQISGAAQTVYRLEERFVRFRVDSVVETPAASPLRWSAPEYSPANPTTP